jgi:hypothetical protein
MIFFNKKITLNQTRSGQWRLQTDRGEDYLLSEINATSTPITDWWDKQHKSSLREWQKDIFVQELTRKGYGEDFKLWLVYRAGQGFNQDHDVTIMHHSGHGVWILSTREYQWLIPGGLQEQVFKIEDALLANIELAEDRKVIYNLVDQLNKITYGY